jgi:RNA polymerase sigma-70 factor (ECF subfamily)
LEIDRQLSGLMRSAQDGDRHAYEILLVQVMALVRDFARARVRHPDWAEDVAQETLLSIHRDRHTYDPARPFLPWMYAIARHRLLEFVARQRRRQAREIAGDDAFEGMACAQPDPERSIDAGFIRRALALLSLKQREIIQMLKIEGLSVVEISLRTGLSTSAVKVTAHRGYKRLRKLVMEPANGK